MWSFVVVIFQPDIQIGLQFLYVAIYLFTECGGIELILHGSVEAFTYPVCLWALCLGLGVVYVLDSQIQLELMVLPCATVLSPPVCEDAQQWGIILLIDRQYPVVEHIGGNQGYLAVIELSGGHLGVRVYKGLLIDLSHTFDVAYVVSILRSKVPWVMFLSLHGQLFHLWLSPVQQLATRSGSDLTVRLSLQGPSDAS